MLPLHSIATKDPLNDMRKSGYTSFAAHSFAYFLECFLSIFVFCSVFSFSEKRVQGEVLSLVLVFLTKQKKQISRRCASN